MTRDVEPVHQAVALPFRNSKICLITTSSGKGMIIPKGHVQEGMSPSLIASREEWEEAGLIGIIARRPFGKYTFIKSGYEHTVQVFLLEVTRCVSKWPEQRIRNRIWCSVDSAMLRVSHIELRPLIEQFAESDAHRSVRLAIAKSA